MHVAAVASWGPWTGCRAAAVVRHSSSASRGIDAGDGAVISPQSFHPQHHILDMYYILYIKCYIKCYILYIYEYYIYYILYYIPPPTHAYIGSVHFDSNY
jgi:hypothetical protein